MIPSRVIKLIIDAIREKIPFAKDIEITLEANPSTIIGPTNSDSTELIDLQELKAFGVNRISMGVQSFRDEKLKFLGRLHSAETAEKAYKFLFNAGYKNINLDLMFGCSNETIDNLNYDLDKILELSPQHISIYGLSIEPNSKFIESNKCSDELYTEMYKTIQKRLAEQYNQYEISNFAKKDFESKHNLNYWVGESYLGLGVGAHGYIKNKRLRYENGIDVQKYVTSVFSSDKFDSRNIVNFTEVLTDDDLRLEFILLGLRTQTGINLKIFAERFGKTALKNLLQEADYLIKSGKLFYASDMFLRIPTEYFVIADGIIEEVL